MVSILAGAGFVMVVENEHFMPLIFAGEDIICVAIGASPKLVQETIALRHVSVFVGHKLQAKFCRHGGHRLSPLERADITQHKHDDEDCNKAENKQRFHFSTFLN